MLDLLIHGGLVIDGTGSPGFHAAIGVENERVRVLRGETAGIETRRAIDATGHVVCPGFIDMHAHSGLVILAEPHHAPKVHQGVTTEVNGTTWVPSERSMAGSVTLAPASANAARIVPARRYFGSFIITSAPASRS